VSGCIGSTSLSTHYGSITGDKQLREIMRYTDPNENKLALVEIHMQKTHATQTHTKKFTQD